MSKKNNDNNDFFCNKSINNNYQIFIGPENTSSAMRSVANETTEGYKIIKEIKEDGDIIIIYSRKKSS